MSLRDDVIATARSFADKGNTPENIKAMVEAVHDMDGIMKATYKAGVLEAETSELKTLRRIPIHLKSL
jgi:hypothetical protein